MKVITVGELRKELSQYPDEMQVWTLWGYDAEPTECHGDFKIRDENNQEVLFIS